MENHYMHTGSRMPRKSLTLPKLTGLRSPGLATGMTLRKMMKGLTLFLIFLWSTAASLHAQTLTGTVTDAEGEPLIGVNIQVKGTTTGTATDFDGRFALEGVAEDAVLTVSYVGYQTQEVAVAGQTELAITLLSDVQLLDEVVVVGYGTQRKLNITGAVSSVESKDIVPMTDASAESRLKGRMPGVTIVNDNSPGGSPLIQIRGIGSINNNSPLYIVDGSPISGGLSGIDPNNIESITVLKDAASSAIYGSRASNGVIVVTTKSGRSERKPQISFNARYGVQNFSDKKINKLSPTESAELQWLQYANDGIQPGDPQWGNETYGFDEDWRLPDYLTSTGAKMEDEVDFSRYSYEDPYYGIARYNKEGTDWLELIRNKNAPIQEYNLGVSGGDQAATYNLSAGYFNQEGTIIHTHYKRYNLHLSSSAKIKDILEIGESLSFSFSNRNSSGNQNDLAPLAMAIRASTGNPPYDIEGNFYGGYGSNPISELIRNKDDYTKNLRLLGNAYAQINFLKDFNLRTQFGGDLLNGSTRDRQLIRQESGDREAEHILNKNYSQSLQYSWTNTLNFDKTITGHNVKLLLGTEVVNFENDWLGGRRTGFPFIDYDYMVLDAGEVEQSSSGAFDEWSLLSFFGRANYSFRDKYLLEAVVRRDGSSRFSKENRWGIFPAVSLGWFLSEEPFMNALDWMGFLKLRIGFGKNGNDNVGNYNTFSTYRSNIGESYYNIAGANSTSSVAGFHKFKLGNEEAKWERTNTYNIGVDFSLLNDLLSGSIDFYQRNTKDMLYPDTKPATYGYLSLASVNVGEMVNKGVDLNLMYAARISERMSFNLGINLSHYKNEVLKLNNNENEIRYGAIKREQVYTASMARHPVSSFYGFIVDGIFNTWDEVEAYPKYNPSVDGVDNYSKPGMFKYRDVNGDGKIDDDDRTFFGSPHPKFTFGIPIDIRYKNFDYSLLAQGSVGNKLLNFRYWSRFSGTNEKRLLYESWTEERFKNGEKITVPVITRDGTDELHQPSSYFMEDGTYLRIMYMQLGYTLNSGALRKLDNSSLRIYLQATNLLTITKYKGLDPEVNPSDILTYGLDDSVYPTQKNFTLGFNFIF